MKKEELRNELPDFINGKVIDEKIKEEIVFLLKTDEEFKKYYDELSSSINFLSKAELNSPPDFYFNNLSAKINRKISSPEYKKVKPSWKKIFQYIAPAAAIVLIFIFLFFNNRDEANLDLRSNDNIEIETEKITEQKFEENKSNEAGQDMEIIKNDDREIRNSNSVVNRKSGNIASENLNNINIVEAENETGFYPIIDLDDNYLIEDEFESLPPNQQQEILYNLSKADL
jgi:hypothetical protein